MSESGLERVIQGELELMTSEIRSSRDALDARLDEQFEEIGASGCHWTRDALILDLLRSPATEVEVVDMSARYVDNRVILVTYVTLARDRRVRRSSWWRQSNGTWKCASSIKEPWCRPHGRSAPTPSS